MEPKLTSYTTLAKAIRVEIDHKTDSIFLVFEVVDEQFKKSIKEDWMQDIELKLIERNLVRNG